MDNKLTQQEADRLIDTLKQVINLDEIFVPSIGGQLNFLVNDEKSKKYKVNISRGKIEVNKCTYQGRTDVDIPLIRIDVGENCFHKNPNGEKIQGPHIHIYNEEYGMAYAEKLEEYEDLGHACEIFFEKFSIKDKEKIIYQKEI